MGTFSIWHWLNILIVLLFLFVFSLPALAVAKENTELLTSRHEFLLWIAAFIGVPFIIQFVGGLLGDDIILPLIALVFMLAILYPLYQRFVRRARDTGMGKLIAYLSIIPGVFFVTTLILLVKPSHQTTPSNEIAPT